MERQACILVVEDEAGIADTVMYALRTEGLRGEWLQLGRDAIAAVDRLAPDLIVLDVGLPDISGFEVCKALRKHVDTPVIFLTARNDEIDRVLGLELGGDDYVAKPFSPRELVARIKAVLKRTQTEPVLSGLPPGRFRLDEAGARIDFCGRPLALTRYEYGLLKLLIQAPGRVWSREQIMAQVWVDPGAAFDRTVDAHVRSLRAKLREIAPDLDPIHTHRGLGYSLAVDR